MPKTKKSRKNNNKKQNILTINHFLLVSFVALASYGWYTSLRAEQQPIEKKQDIHENYQVIIIPPIKSNQANKENNSFLQKRTIPLFDAEKPVIDPTVTSVAAVQKPVIVDIPYKPDMDLPPSGRFAVHNAADKLYIKRVTNVFEAPSSSSKILASLNENTEIRSYEENNGWHHIVVPKTNVIGWIKADYL